MTTGHGNFGFFKKDFPMQLVDEQIQTLVREDSFLWLKFVFDMMPLLGHGGNGTFLEIGNTRSYLWNKFSVTYDH